MQTNNFGNNRQVCAGKVHLSVRARLHAKAFELHAQRQRRQRQHQEQERSESTEEASPGRLSGTIILGGILAVVAVLPRKTCRSFCAALVSVLPHVHCLSS